MWILYVLAKIILIFFFKIIFNLFEHISEYKSNVMHMGLNNLNDIKVKNPTEKPTMYFTNGTGTADGNNLNPGNMQNQPAAGNTPNHSVAGSAQNKIVINDQVGPVLPLPGEVAIIVADNTTPNHKLEDLNRKIGQLENILKNLKLHFLMK